MIIEWKKKNKIKERFWKEEKIEREDQSQNTINKLKRKKRKEKEEILKRRKKINK